MMANDQARHIEYRGGEVVSDTTRELTDAEQVIKDRGQRLADYRDNQSPTAGQTAQATRDMMAESGM